MNTGSYRYLCTVVVLLAGQSLLPFLVQVSSGFSSGPLQRFHKAVRVIGRLTFWPCVGPGSFSRVTCLTCKAAGLYGLTSWSFLAAFLTSAPRRESGQTVDQEWHSYYSEILFSHEKKYFFFDNSKNTYWAKEVRRKRVQLLRTIPVGCVERWDGVQVALMSLRDQDLVAGPGCVGGTWAEEGWLARAQRGSPLNKERSWQAQCPYWAVLCMGYVFAPRCI